jgi:hypothetical protein
VLREGKIYIQHKPKPDSVTHRGGATQDRDTSAHFALDWRGSWHVQSERMARGKGAL